MKDAFVMWRNPRMVVLSAVCAAVYAAAMIPFKVLVIFPGLAEVRPAAALPIVFSFLFGPAGAWGAGFGNVVGDMLGGMLGPGSIFGFFANFAYGYIPYKLWEALVAEQSVKEELERWRSTIPDWLTRANTIALILVLVFMVSGIIFALVDFSGLVDFSAMAKWKSGDREVSLGTPLAIILFSSFTTIGVTSIILLIFSPIRLIFVIFIACLACAGILGWGVDLLGFFPFRVFALWILANNFILSVILVPSLLLLLHPRVSSAYMLYTDLLYERGDGPGRRRAGAVIVVCSTVLLFLAGVLVGPDQIAALLGSSSSLLKGLIYSPFVLFLIFGLFLL